MGFKKFIENRATEIERLRSKMATKRHLAEKERSEKLESRARDARATIRKHNTQEKYKKDIARAEAIKRESSPFNRLFSSPDRPKPSRTTARKTSPKKKSKSSKPKRRRRRQSRTQSRYEDSPFGGGLFG